MTKNFISSVILILIIFFQQTYCQTVNLAGVDVSIGDSLNSIQAKINTDFFIFSRVEGDSLNDHNKMKQTWVLHDKTPPNNLIAIIYFFAPPIKYWMGKTAEQPTVTAIQKFWDYGNSNVVDVMKKFYDLLEIYGIDEYFNNHISFNKEVEPDGTSYNINVSTCSWRRIEFSFSKDSFQLSEIITENSYQFFYDKRYCLFFDDYKHYSSKKSDIITESFSHEEAAQRRQRELQLPYLSRGEEIPTSKILRLLRKTYLSK
ncbi:MAG: hypothetical protein M0P61_07265 [Ignavibacteriaceae bacterium]|jgi:hypothetical protein|nr:hypothetical protein [Ignavibacteriaceae bacterium]